MRYIKGAMKKLSSKVLYWDDERSIGNSLIVTLKSGWRFNTGPLLRPDDATHVEGFDTVREANAAVAKAVKCECYECFAELAKALDNPATGRVL